MQCGLLTLFDFFADRQTEVASYTDTLECMMYAEQLGCDSVWVGEEHFSSFSICPSPQRLLTAVARATTRLRLGTALSVLPLEHPLRQALDLGDGGDHAQRSLTTGYGTASGKRTRDGFGVSLPIGSHYV